MSVIHAPEENRFDTRQWIIPGVLAVMFGVFALRLWYLQVVLADDLREQAQRSGQVTSATLAPRGRIVDRNNVMLADVQPTLVVQIAPETVDRYMKHRDPAKRRDLLQELSVILQVPRDRLRRTMIKFNRRASIPSPVYVGASVQQAVRLAEAQDAIPSLEVVRLSMRRYAETYALSHIMGWVAAPTERDEARLQLAGITPADYVGRDGIEQYYEQALMGTPGRILLGLDSKGRPSREIPGSEEPQPGDTLVLSLDIRLQRLAQELLKGKRGSVIALDPRNGDVLAMVSSPAYDTKMFEGGLTQAESDALHKSESRPLLKRAIAGRYPPGSTMKVVTTIAAALNGTFNPREVIYCPGYLTMGNRRVRCENHPPGAMTFENAMARSCNTFFGRMAQRLGEEGLQHGCHECGLGEPTGVDLAGESGGRVPDDATIQRLHGRPWSIGDSNNVGIGQGDLEVTPLQMAQVAALVANSGRMYPPRLLRARGEGSTGPIQVLTPGEAHTVNLDASFWSTLRSSMRAVVSYGTGRRSAQANAVVAGKTGSAQNSMSRKPHAWYIGFAPYDNPTIAFAVVVEAAGHGGEVAAPIAGELLRAYFSPRPTNSESASPNMAARSDASLAFVGSPAAR